MSADVDRLVAEAMNSAMDRAGIKRVGMGQIATAEREALDALVAWRRGHFGDEPDAWTRLRTLIAATDALLDARAMHAAISSSQALVRDLVTLPCGHRPEDACAECTVDPDMPSLVALAERHDLRLCHGASDCTCPCTPCMHEHEGALS